MIAGLVDRQGEQLAKLDISIVTIMAPEDAGFLFALLRMSHSWRINLLLLENNTPHDLGDLGQDEDPKRYQL